MQGQAMQFSTMQDAGVEFKTTELGKETNWNENMEFHKG